MRDIKRIRKFCNRLADLWEMTPDLRFGQLISNALGYVQSETKRDIFFIEEDEMLKTLEKYFGVESSSRNECDDESICVVIDAQHMEADDARDMYELDEDEDEIDATVYFEDDEPDLEDLEILSWDDLDLFEKKRAKEREFERARFKAQFGKPTDEALFKWISSDNNAFLCYLRSCKYYRDGSGNICVLEDASPLACRMAEYNLKRVRERAHEELKAFTNKLYTSPPSVIIENAYRLTLYNEIVCALEDPDEFDGMDFEELAQKECILDFLYQLYLDSDYSGLHEDIVDVILSTEE